jgi:hypothetical protein
MALLRLTEADGKHVWVNPLHVRWVALKSGVFGGKKGTEIALSGISGLHGGVVLVVIEEPELVASLVSQSLLHLATPFSSLDDDQPAEGGLGG